VPDLARVLPAYTLARSSGHRQVHHIRFAGGRQLAPRTDEVTRMTRGNQPRNGASRHTGRAPDTRIGLAPAIGEQAVGAAVVSQSHGPRAGSPIGRQLTYLRRLVDLDAGARCLVVGCGPHPDAVRILAREGLTVTGLEPEPGLAASASTFVGNEARIVVGAAEDIPVDDHSQDLVVCESVLEHVDSVRQTLAELYRVLAPGGALWVTTTNRWAVSPTGQNGEFRLPFFNWYPAVVKEAYVHHHLHHDPTLANFTPRPAVHWFTFDALCRVGREAGFARFYSILDLLDPADPSIAPSQFRRAVVNAVRRHPVVRALALTQVGGTIIMVKR
jgi:ubiquinone/menaquinone biosynthesis C-methylase UbiE